MTITSSLKQGSLCPGDIGATITCTTIGNALIWDINGHSFSFRERNEIGQFHTRNGYSMSLLRKESIGAGEHIFVSTLHIPLGSLSSTSFRIGCDNGRQSSRKFLEYVETVNGKCVRINQHNIFLLYFAICYKL